MQGMGLGSSVPPTPSASCPALPGRSLLSDSGTCGEEQTRKGEEGHGNVPG